MKVLNGLILMMKNYYFLATALPDLQIGTPPDISFKTFDFLLKMNLAPEDYQQSVVMRRYYDIQNIRFFWMEEEWDPRGYYNENELEEALLTQMGLPGYVYEYLEKYEHLEERLHNFPALVSAYFLNEIAAAEGFLREYLIFEREWRLVLAGFRAKKLGRDVVAELQFEDPYDEVVAQILAQKDAESYEPPTRYGDLKALFEEHYDAPLELYQAMCEYRFQKVETMYGIDVFSISRILAYMAQLIIVEKWLELDKKQGLQVVDEIVKEAS